MFLLGEMFHEFFRPALQLFRAVKLPSFTQILNFLMHVVDFFLECLCLGMRFLLFVAFIFAVNFGESMTQLMYLIPCLVLFSSNRSCNTLIRFTCREISACSASLDSKSISASIEICSRSSW